MAVKSGDFEDAEAQLGAALRIQSEQIDALIFMSTMRRAQRRLEEAVDYGRRAAMAEPHNPVALNALGVALLEANLAGEAVAVFSQALALNSRSAQAHHNLGLALNKDARPSEAAAAFRSAIRLAPDNPNSYVELYRQLDWLQQWSEAVTALKQGALRRPDAVPLLLALAKAHSQLGETDEAARRFKQALRLDPSSAQHYGLWLQETGRFDQSIEFLQQSINLNPTQGLAYYLLSEAKAFDLPDGPLLDRVRAVDKTQLDPGSQMYLAYARARCHDRVGEYGEAMTQLDEANDIAYDLFAAARPYDAAEARRRIDDVQAVCTPANLECLRERGPASVSPILIIGMIRSGTTLLDQILSSHPDVASAGEQAFWNLRYRGLEASMGAVLASDAPAHAMEGFSNELGSMANEYLGTLGRVAGDARRITDKMPTNYQFLGLIHGALPAARFIHVRRSPLDTCLSIYTTHFGRGPDWIYNRDNIVANYRDYLREMAYWRSVLPADRFIEIDYEALVKDREGVIRRVLEFCELPWDDACLRHEENRSVVMTPSRWQARQPVYTSSVGRWQKYEPWLGVFRSLGAE